MFCNIILYKKFHHLWKSLFIYAYIKSHTYTIIWWLSNNFTWKFSKKIKINWKNTHEHHCTYQFRKNYLSEPTNQINPFIKNSDIPIYNTFHPHRTIKTWKKLIFRWLEKWTSANLNKKGSVRRLRSHTRLKHAYTRIFPY